jgi:threonine dehydrogenase-like Zn-dependent dehydrogenase
MDPSRDIIMGHEFCGEIVDHGRATTRNLKPGTRVCSVPFLIRADGLRLIGFSDETPGGYGEYMRLTEGLLLEVPNGLAAAHAALTEPMSVGTHAVEKGRVERNDVPLVIGCGPIGLAVIAALRLRGLHPIVAADFSPRRRQLAEALGADVVVNPSTDSPYKKWNDVAVWTGPDAPTPPPWVSGPPLRPSVIFECVGVPGIIDRVIASAPTNARVVVVGVCMQRDYVEPIIAITKELNLQFVFGYTPEEFLRKEKSLLDCQAVEYSVLCGSRPTSHCTTKAYQGRSVGPALLYHASRTGSHSNGALRRCRRSDALPRSRSGDGRREVERGSVSRHGSSLTVYCLFASLNSCL